MTETQERLLKMLEWFDIYCRNNNIRYYVVGGTLLGAVRHNGFIPWDDDIDIGVPRKDYEKLERLIGNNCHDGYYYETVHSKDRRFCYSFGKLYDTNTTLIENLRTELKRGLYLDIFPLDGLGNDETPDTNWYKKICFYNNFLIARVAGLRKGRNPIKNFMVRVSRLLPSKLFGEERMRTKVDNLCQKYDFDDSKWAGNLVGNWGMKEILERSCFGEPTEYTFETIKVFGPKCFDEYLTHIYGNWKELPPVEKQKSHHDYAYCDLHASYCDGEERICTKTD